MNYDLEDSISDSCIQNCEECCHSAICSVCAEWSEPHSYRGDEFSVDSSCHIPECGVPVVVVDKLPF
jgi:hypothetical protein